MGWLFLTNGFAHCTWLCGKRSALVVADPALLGRVHGRCLLLLWCAVIAAYDASSTGVFSYGALSVGSSACCVFAWRDAISAVRVHRAVTGSRLRY